MKFNTKVIHGNQHPEPSTGSVMTPIYQTSTYAQKSPGNHKGYEYARGSNPTRSTLENAIASVENGTHAYTFASGLAAIDAVLRLLNPNDEVIAGLDIYGGTYRMFTQIFLKYQIKFLFVDMSDITAVEKAITSKTKLIWLETPTNPLLKIADISVITNIAKNHQILTAVDNTFATPYIQQPLNLGVDIVMHSVTKYLGGHSDLIMGALVVRNEELAKQLKFIQYAVGAIAGPMDSFLALRGIKTLAIRMQRHCENAIKIAQFLNEHDKVERVYFPGLSTHENHDIAKKQMNSFGGMVSFKLMSKSRKDTFTFLENLNLFTIAESLGGVESLANHSATMTHASLPESERIKLGITDNLIRLSVGIEDCEDLILDLRQAFTFI